VPSRRRRTNRGTRDHVDVSGQWAKVEVPILFPGRRECSSISFASESWLFEKEASVPQNRPCIVVLSEVIERQLKEFSVVIDSRSFMMVARGSCTVIMY
jgi:hypothetical protein